MSLAIDAQSKRGAAQNRRDLLCPKHPTDIGRVRGEEDVRRGIRGERADPEVDAAAADGRLPPADEHRVTGWIEANEFAYDYLLILRRRRQRIAATRRARRTYRVRIVHPLKRAIRAVLHDERHKPGDGGDRSSAEVLA